MLATLLRRRHRSPTPTPTPTPTPAPAPTPTPTLTLTRFHRLAGYGFGSWLAALETRRVFLGKYTAFAHRAAASWISACMAGAWRAWRAATAARWSARLVARRWLSATIAAAWRTWKGEVSDALQRAAGAWAGRAVAPAWRKLAACAEARRRLRTALVGWANRHACAALRQWCAMHQAWLAEERLMRRVLGYWARRMLGSGYRTWRESTLQAHEP